MPAIGAEKGRPQGVGGPLEVGGWGFKDGMPVTVVGFDDDGRVAYVMGHVDVYYVAGPVQITRGPR